MSWTIYTSTGATKSVIAGSTSNAVAVYKSGAQSIANASEILVTFNTEGHDYGNMHDNVTNNSRLIAKESGVFNIAAMLAFAANSTGLRGFIIRKNAAGTPGGGAWVAAPSQTTVQSPANASPTCSTQVYLSAGDYVELFAYQDSGAALNINGGSGQTQFSMSLVSTAPITLNATADYGDLKATARATAPGGWLLCFGQAISRTTYNQLFAAIGTAYGVGDGSTTFNLPDLRGRAIAGLDNMGGVDAGRLSLANTLGTTAGSQTNSHTHSTNANIATRVSDGITGLIATDGSVSGQTSQGTASKNFLPVGFPSAGINVNQFAVTSGAPTDTNVMQPTMLLNWCIYVGTGL